MGTSAGLSATEEAALSSAIQRGLAALRARLGPSSAGLTPEAVLAQARELEPVPSEVEVVERARDELYRAIEKWAMNIAWRWDVPRGLEREDITQASIIGALRAVLRFDPARGRLTTITSTWVRQSLQRTVEDERLLVRVPGGRQADLRAGRLPDAEVQRLRRLAHPLPIDGEKGRERTGALRRGTVDPPAPAEEERADRGDVLAEIRRLLPEHEAAAVSRRFGLCGGEPQTWRELSTVLGISPEGARIRVARSLEKLRGSRAMQCEFSFCS